MSEILKEYWITTRVLDGPEAEYIERRYYLADRVDAILAQRELELDTFIKDMESDGGIVARERGDTP